MSSFNELKVKDLRRIIVEYKKRVGITKYSKLRKAQLVELLESKFKLHNGSLFLRHANTAPTSVTAPPPARAKKRITPQLVTTQVPEPVPTPPPAVIAQHIPPVITQPIFRTAEPILTTGQQRFQKKLNRLEQKALKDIQIRKDSNLAKRIRGSR